MKKIVEKVNDYFNSCIQEHGMTSKGVGWNGQESHDLRFEQLVKIINKETDFSILDYGCGYGALIEYMKRYYENFNYSGYDISEEMIKTAKSKFHDYSNALFTSNENMLLPVDYTIINGVFNVKLDSSNKDWQEFIIENLKKVNELSIKGFSFNMLTKYSDIERMEDYLYYGDPCFFFDLCKKSFSKNVALLHDYKLYDFTILVRKDL